MLHRIIHIDSRIKQIITIMPMFLTNQATQAACRPKQVTFSPTLFFNNKKYQNQEC
jgi:hypothetical protein